MKNIKVVNVKCSWCANTVKIELEKIWIKNINIWFSENDSAKSRNIEFEWDFDLVKEKLTNLGYPEVWSTEAKSFLKKAKSFISCASGKMSK
jgi:copper chaperone CopZ